MKKMIPVLLYAVLMLTFVIPGFARPGDVVFIPVDEPIVFGNFASDNQVYYGLFACEKCFRRTPEFRLFHEGEGTCDQMQPDGKDQSMCQNETDFGV